MRRRYSPTTGARPAARAGGRHLLSAAEQAGRGWAKEEAVALYNQALELMPQDDGRRRDVELKRAIDYAAFAHIEDARQARRAPSAEAKRLSR